MEKSAILLVATAASSRASPSSLWLKTVAWAIRDGLIAETGPTASLRRNYRGAHFIDARGGLIMPGLIQHAHASLQHVCAWNGAERRGSGNFTEILERLWWRLDKVLTLDDVYLSAAVAMIDCIRNGATHHLRSPLQPRRCFRQPVSHRRGCTPDRTAQLPLLRSDGSRRP